MVFDQKGKFFQHSFFQAIQARKMSITILILERKNAFRGYKNKTFKKVEKLKLLFWSMVLDQKWPFFQLYFLGTIGQENVFYDILEGKNAFRGFKNKKFKKSKN